MSDTAMQNESLNGPASRASILIADGHPVVVQGTRAALEREPGLTVLDVALSEQHLLRLAGTLAPDMLIMERTLGGTSCFELIKQIRAIHPDIRVVVYSDEIDAPTAMKALRSHIDGVVLKTMPNELFLACVKKVAAGGRWIEMHSFSDAVEKLIEQQDVADSLTGVLSPRELEMVKWVSEGLRNKEIARKAHVSEGTVKTHLHNIYEKLGLGSRLELMKFARDKGLTNH